MSTASSDPESTGGGDRKRRRSLRGEVGTTGARFGSPALRRSLGDEPAEEPKPVRRRRSLRGEIGATGARFGSAALRRSLEEQQQDEAPLEETAPFEGPYDYVEPPPVPFNRRPEPEPEPAVEEFSGPLVRPYAWTGGRTSASYDLRLETLVSLEENGIAIAMRDTTAEQRSIVEMCANPRSVAEVSALLSVPLGVVRVLLSDLITMGIVVVHHNAAAPGGPDLTLLERVLAGLRNL
ncbi:DUF742 domain-containing protein [Saccharothrix deserti]|uniref:DUF742 domain-containing protein n=1 Tax=Saccharothrix deserti TaxID=2593674 RepID=UPI00131C0606|nr:DUF742 domain-containing protein [Saccharothrix deserti]